MTLDEFLALPETEPASEFACGRIIPRPMPSFFHGYIAALFGHLFTVYFERNPIGFVISEPRHANRGEGRAYLPDVAIILRTNLPRSREALTRGPLEFRPDIAIEVLSHDDRPVRVADKLAFYLRTGVPLVWIIDPEEQTLTAYRPGEAPTMHEAPEVIDAKPVLPGFTLDLAGMFAQLPEE